mmetsp:Transcript_31080/g.99733  ORF Transcript_31080/g.99733 Transcript_31080/m.99733 type:complete len:284 (+) Transcript_31080:1610-2461(+)
MAVSVQPGMSVPCYTILLKVHLGPVLNRYSHLSVVADFALSQDALSPGPVREHPDSSVVAHLALAHYSLPSALAHDPVHPIPVHLAALAPSVPVVSGEDSALAAPAQVASFRHQHAVLRYHHRDPPITPHAAVVQVQGAAEALDGPHSLLSPPRRVSSSLIHGHPRYAHVVGKALEQRAAMAALQYDSVVAIADDGDRTIENDLFLVQASVYHDRAPRRCSADGRGDAREAAHPCPLAHSKRTVVLRHRVQRLHLGRRTRRHQVLLGLRLGLKLRLRQRLRVM